MTIASHQPASSKPGVSVFAIPQSWLPASLAVIAGMVDLTSFVTLGGVFTAHITGNLVVLAAVAIRGGALNPAQALAVPMFILAVAAVWLVVRRERARRAVPSRKVLLAQFLLLAAVLGIAVGADVAQHPHGMAAFDAVLLAACAMAAQNGLLHLQIDGAPSTAVMTGNLVSAVIAGLDVIVSDPDHSRAAQSALGRPLTLLGGFLLGCVLAAAALLVDRNWGWAAPAAFAGLVAIAPWRRRADT